jgi:hypothetical protein
MSEKTTAKRLSHKYSYARKDLAPVVIFSPISSIKSRISEAVPLSSSSKPFFLSTSAASSRAF